MNAYNIFLNFGPESPYGDFFKAFVPSTVVLNNGSKVFRLECTAIDESLHYLLVVPAEKSMLAGIQVRIPHHMVLVVVDAVLPEKVFGFAPSTANPE